MKTWLFLSLLCLKAFALEGHEVLKQGRLEAMVEWTMNDMGGDALASLLTFTPTVSAPSCERLDFIQIARVRNSQGQDFQWRDFEGQANRNLLRTENGFFIDHDASKCQKGKACSPFYRDSWSNEAESADGLSLDDRKAPASMFDAPYGWELFESIELEACAICQNRDKLSPLACVSWGGVWPTIGDRRILPLQFSNSASASFFEALKLFKQFYGMTRSSVQR